MHLMYQEGRNIDLKQKRFQPDKLGKQEKL